MASEDKEMEDVREDEDVAALLAKYDRLTLKEAPSANRIEQLLDKFAAHAVDAERVTFLRPDLTFCYKDAKTMHAGSPWEPVQIAGDTQYAPLEEWVDEKLLARLGFVVVWLHDWRSTSPVDSRGGPMGEQTWHPAVCHVRTTFVEAARMSAINRKFDGAYVFVPDTRWQVCNAYPGKGE